MPRRLDPGRAELRHEYCSGAGEERLCLALGCGGQLFVHSHAASEQEVPQSWPIGSWQEWRTLTFEPAPELSGEAGPRFIQSVAKVTCSPFGGRPEADAEVLALNYPKTFAAAVAAGLHLLGNSTRPRILVIGLGSGSVPLWLANVFDESMVDVLELEPAVLCAARDALGFPAASVSDQNYQACSFSSPSQGHLRAFQGDGALYAAACAADDQGPRYDAVLIDAYDALNQVPRSLVSSDGPLARALPHLLTETGLVAANVPPGFPVQDMMQAYCDSLHAAEQLESASLDTIAALSLQVPETANSVSLVLRRAPAKGDELRRLLGHEASLFPTSYGCRFDARRRIMECELETL